MKHIKELIAMLLALSLLCSLAACGNQNSTSSNQPQQSSQQQPTESVEPVKEGFQPYTFIDDLGHEIEINEEITAIVPSGQLAQVILLGIAPDLMVGLGGQMSDNMAEYIPDYDRLSQLTYFGTVLGAADLDVEALASTNAQLVIDVGYTKTGYEEELATTQELTGITCVFIEAKLDDYGEAIRKLGQLLGREEKAEEMAVWCEEVYDRALDIMEQVGDNKVNGIYALGDGGLNVIAESQSQAEVINLVFNNLAVIENASGKGSGNPVNIEQIALWNPDFVIFGAGSIYDTVAEDAAWSQISAIANGKYVESPESPHNWTAAPPACQRYLALLWLPSILYPEYCDYDLQEEVTEYYELFYGVTLTDEQYAALTANAFFK
ncbi:MAG: ABC transporter substrate-binding protein [Clostridiales bacterium]|uniref:ABC transporter substrate-binding protein n=1 Tax=Flavonifractor porci TaxID=3133422 RepID=UPI00309E1B15|nr:ABC transporter substrate-binding protein [Clostridiales bacterium]